MFDLTTLALQDSILKHNQKKLLEAQQEMENKNKQNMNMILDGLANQYKALNETNIAKSFERNRLIEAVAINGVKEVVYGIFKESLLLDESAKTYYSNTLTTLFDTKFQNVLNENSVTSLKQFRDIIKKSHPMLESVVNKAYDYANINEKLYTNLLETYYSNSSIYNIITETYDVLTEEEFMDEKFIDKLSFLSDSIREELISNITNKNIGEQIIQLILLLNRGLYMDKNLVVYNRANLLNKIITVISMYIKLVDDEISNINNDEQTLILYSAIFDKLPRLLLLTGNMYKTKVDLSSTINTNSIRNLQEKALAISFRIDNLVRENKTLLSSKLNESFINILTEAEYAIANNDESKLESLFNIIRQRLKFTLTNLDPYKGLEELKFANKMIKEHNQYQSFLAFGVSGGTWVYLIIKILKSKDLPESVEAQYIKEANKFKSNLLKLIALAEKDGRTDIKHLKTQLETLTTFLDKYTTDKSSATQKVIKESNIISNLFSNPIHSDVLFENQIEMLQYSVLYETNISDITKMIKILKENDAAIDNIDDKKLLLDNIYKEVVDITKSDELKLGIAKECVKLESVLYKQLHGLRPNSVSADADENLKAGNYPSSENFLDTEEKDLINTMVKFNGKDNAVDIIKNKIISVIENEEKRTKEKDENEQIMLNKLSRDNINTTLEESSKLSFNNGRLNMPETLFEAIVMNRSKKYIQEAATNGTGIDILSKKDVILSESIVLYTIHETFNTLDFGRNDYEYNHKLMNDYYYGKL